jgi:hypothetical protein
MKKIIKKNRNTYKNIILSQKKKYNIQDSYQKKNISFNYVFISHLFLNHKNFFERYNFAKEKHIYLFAKKKFWKFISKSLLIHPYDYFKTLELIIVGKKLNMKKNLTKLSSLFITKKISPYFWWEIVLNLENLKKNKSFDFDLIFLYGITKTNFGHYFFQQYFFYKIKTLDNTFYNRTNEQNLNFSGFLKIKYLERILLIIGFNLFKLNSFNFLCLIMNNIGKNIWMGSHNSLSLEEMINLMISRLKIFSIAIETIKTVTFPKLPVLHSFWLFSNLRENSSNSVIFLNITNIKSNFKKNKVNLGGKAFEKSFPYYTSSLIFIKKDFFLYH